MDPSLPVTAPRASFPPEVIDRIHQMADSGQYPIRGLGARRSVPTFDDLLFLTASTSRYPLEGYRERCETRTVLGGRHGARPIELAIPITIAGMSFGALSASAKDALGRAATAVGTSTTTGDGGMTPEERKSSATLVYQVDVTGGVVTVSPIDITSTAGLSSFNSGMATGTRVRVSGVPQATGSVKAYVITYFTGTTPAS